MVVNHICFLTLDCVAYLSIADWGTSPKIIRTPCEHLHTFVSALFSHCLTCPNFLCMPITLRVAFQFFVNFTDEGTGLD